MKLLDDLFHSPVTTTAGAQKRLGISYNGAKKLIERMIDLGILEPALANSSKSKLFVARPILRVLEADY